MKEIFNRLRYNTKRIIAVLCVICILFSSATCLVLTSLAQEVLSRPDLTGNGNYTLIDANETADRLIQGKGAAFPTVNADFSKIPEGNYTVAYYFDYSEAINSGAASNNALLKIYFATSDSTSDRYYLDTRVKATSYAFSNKGLEVTELKQASATNTELRYNAVGGTVGYLVIEFNDTLIADLKNAGFEFKDIINTRALNVGTSYGADFIDATVHLRDFGYVTNKDAFVEEMTAALNYGAVISAIDRLNNPPTIDEGEAIQSIRAMYDALYFKDKVTNYDKFLEVEEAFELGNIGTPTRPGYTDSGNFVITDPNEAADRLIPGKGAAFPVVDADFSKIPKDINTVAYYFDYSEAKNTGVEGDAPLLKMYFATGTSTADRYYLDTRIEVTSYAFSEEGLTVTKLEENVGGEYRYRPVGGTVGYIVIKYSEELKAELREKGFEFNDIINTRALAVGTTNGADFIDATVRYRDFGYVTNKDAFVEEMTLAFDYASVINEIEKLNNPPSLADAEAIKSVRAKYNALDSSVKGMVTNYNKLKEIEHAPFVIIDANEGADSKITSTGADFPTVNADFSKVPEDIGTITYYFDYSEAKNSGATAPKMEIHFETSDDKQYYFDENVKFTAYAFSDEGLAVTQLEQDSNNKYYRPIAGSVGYIVVEFNKAELLEAGIDFNKVTSIVTLSKEASYGADFIGANVHFRDFGYLTDKDAFVEKITVSLNYGAVISAIDELNDIPSADDAEAIQNVRAMYDALDSTFKGKVTNYDRFLMIENAFISLYDVEGVINAINRIGPAITANSLELIRAAEEAYNKLDDTYKLQVTNLDVLEKAIQQLEIVMDVDGVIEKINSIGEVNENSFDKLEAVLNSYLILDHSLKENVTNYSVLEEALSKYCDLQTAETISALISSIPENIEKEDYAHIVIARQSYDSLAVAERENVTNYNVLQEKEKELNLLIPFYSAEPGNYFVLNHNEEATKTFPSSGQLSASLPLISTDWSYVPENAEAAAFYFDFTDAEFVGSNSSLLQVMDLCSNGEVVIRPNRYDLYYMVDGEFQVQELTSGRITLPPGSFGFIVFPIHDPYYEDVDFSKIDSIKFGNPDWLYGRGFIGKTVHLRNFGYINSLNALKRGMRRLYLDGYLVEVQPEGELELSLDQINADNIKLSWKDLPEAHSYTVSVFDENKDFVVGSPFPFRNQTNVDFYGLTANTKYYVQLFALDKSGKTITSSNAIEFRTALKNEETFVDSLIEAEDFKIKGYLIDGKNVKVLWDHIDGVEYYKLNLYTEDDKGTLFHIFSQDIKVAPYELTLRGLEYKTNYVVQVVAYDFSGSIAFAYQPERFTLASESTYVPPIEIGPVEEETVGWYETQTVYGTEYETVLIDQEVEGAGKWIREYDWALNKTAIYIYIGLGVLGLLLIAGSVVLIVLLRRKKRVNDKI